MVLCDCPQGLHHKSNRKSAGAADASLSGHSVCPEGLWVQVFNWSRPHPAEGTNTGGYHGDSEGDDGRGSRINAPPPVFVFVVCKR